ncbi:hypothetical protein MPTK2_8g16240 [Marchantia polymorpha subsp. ruderalis]
MTCLPLISRNGSRCLSAKFYNVKKRDASTEFRNRSAYHNKPLSSFRRRMPKERQGLWWALTKNHELVRLLLVLRQNGAVWFAHQCINSRFSKV